MQQDAIYECSTWNFREGSLLSGSARAIWSAPRDSEVELRSVALANERMPRLLVLNSASLILPLRIAGFRCELGIACSSAKNYAHLAGVLNAPGSSTRSLR